MNKMYYPSLFLALFIFSFSFTPTSFAATPYNALAAKLKSDTTTGVFNSGDNIKSNTEVKGVVWGLNGSTFIVRLPKDDAGYNILITKDTTIRKNGKPATKKDLIKGKDVTVIGDLDTSTFTVSALTIDLGTPTANTIASVPVKSVEKKEVPELSETVKPATKKVLTKSLKLGNKNADVQLLQDKLVTLEFLAKTNATGYYGQQTVKAVKAFQKAHKLDQTGTVGPKTLTLLNK